MSNQVWDMLIKLNQLFGIMFSTSVVGKVGDLGSMEE